MTMGLIYKHNKTGNLYEIVGEGISTTKYYHSDEYGNVPCDYDVIVYKKFPFGKILFSRADSEFYRKFTLVENPCFSTDLGRLIAKEIERTNYNSFEETPRCKENIELITKIIKEYFKVEL